MSYIITYRVQGNFSIPKEAIDRLELTEQEKSRILQLESLSEEVMTVIEYKELESLRALKTSKVTEYNGLKITSEDEDVCDTQCHLYYNSVTREAYIPGHEGSNLNFKMLDNGTLILLDGYFHDNYDVHLSLVVEVAEAVNAEIEVVYISDEERGEDSEYAGRVIYIVINGVIS